MAAIDAALLQRLLEIAFGLPHRASSYDRLIQAHQRVLRELQQMERDLEHDLRQLW